MKLTMEDLNQIIEDNLSKALADKAIETREMNMDKAKLIQSDPVAAKVIKAAKEEADKAKKVEEAGGIYEYKEAEERKEDAWRAIRCVIASGNDHTQAIKLAKHWGYKKVESALIKAQGEGTLGGGGALVPTGYIPDVIEALRAESVMMQMGITVIPMPNGNLQMSRVSSGGTGSWVGENQNNSSTSLTLQQLNLDAKYFTAVVPYSNRLLKHSSPKIDQVIKQDLINEISSKTDLAMIRSLGTAYSPQGMRYLVDSGNSFAATASSAPSTLAEMTADIAKMVRLVEEDKVTIRNGGFLGSPRSYWKLYSVQTSTGAFAFRDELMMGTLFGFKIKSTSNIPSNLGSGTDESEFYFASFQDLVYGDDESLEIKSYDGATYYDGSSLVSGLSQDQSVIRAKIGMDFGARHNGVEMSVLTTVKWY